MKIAVLVHDGSSLGITAKTLWGDAHQVGCGGSESALITLCEGWTQRGYDVVLYNDPREAGASVFEQRPRDAYNPQEFHDAVITFRSPNPKALIANTDLRVWLSFDQFTLPSCPFDKFAPHMDKIVGISEFHSEHFKTHYGINDMIVIDLPVRVQDFDFKIEKIPNRLIFTSVPGRGLMNLHAVWPTIKKEIPDATLAITSDYRLWGLNNPNNQQYYQHFMPFMSTGDVQFLGALPRKDYLEALMKSEIFAYPHKEPQGNHELFCISCSEAQYAGVYPITSTYGALETTNMGTLISGDPTKTPFRKAFVDTIVETLSDRDKLVTERSKIGTAAYQRFHPDTILDQWEEKVFC